MASDKTGADRAGVPIDETVSKPTEKKTKPAADKNAQKAMVIAKPKEQLIFAYTGNVLYLWMF